MNPEIYFIADSHFHPYPNQKNKQRRQLFIDFLTEINNKADRLYILGDLFDFWFEYKYVVPRYLIDIIAELQNLSQSGCQITYIGGNHDFWLYDFFPENGIEISPTPATIEIGKNKFYLTHGEEAVDSAPFYPLVQKLLRSKITIQLFRMLHPDLAFKIAHIISNMSRERELTAEQVQKYTRRLITFSQNKFKQGYDKVIMGHFHIPKLHREDNKTALCLGDWIQHFTYGQYKDGTLHLKYFK